jgi:transcriptional regulator with XRE-family HTH domain
MRRRISLFPSYPYAHIVSAMGALAYIRKTIFGMSQIEFADAVGVNQSTVSRWETGDLEPSRAEMARIRDMAAERRIAWDDRWFFEPPSSPVAPVSRRRRQAAVAVR